MTTPRPDGMNLSPKMKLVAARAMIRERNPYFAVLIQSCTYVWVPRGSLNTMGVTKNGVVYVDEADIERLTVEQVAVSVLHETAGHWLRDHAGRMPKGAPQMAWNLAGDCEINDDLKAAGWKVDNFPNGGLVFPSSYEMKDGLTAEEYYANIRDKQSKQKKYGKGGEGEARAGDGQNQSGPGSEPSCGQGWCGSGAGRPLPKEPGDGQKKQGDFESAPGKSGGEADRVRKAVAKAMQQHEKQNGRGSVPGNWSRWADDMLQPPKVDWRSKLNQLVRDAIAYRPGAVRSTYKKMGRRQAAIGYGRGRPMMPSYRNPIPNVAVCVDTSGSMGTEELKLAVSETDGILKALMAEVDFLAIDCHVHTTTKLRNASEIEKHLKGGGGTDFRPAFEQLRKGNGPKGPPEVVIFITDGDGPAPEVPPRGMKVVWVLVGRHARKPYVENRGGSAVPWGTFLVIESQDSEVTDDVKGRGW